MMKNIIKTLPLLLLISFMPRAWADVKSMRTDSIDGFYNDFEIEMGATFTALSADQSTVNNEYFTSIDIATSLPTSDGEWLIYVEGNSSPRVNGVNESIVGVNGDVGSALDSDGNGRLQISELHYSWKLLTGTITAGLVDLSGFIDTSDIANDENTQFLSANFTNNPTIAFPDYTLALGYVYAPDNQNWGMVVLLAGSHGIADNEKTTYSQLVKLGDNNKGAFSAIEGFYLIETTTLKFGVWHSTADYELLTKQEKFQSNYGVYGSAEGANDLFSWNVRLGVANADVSPVKQFVSAAIELAVNQNTLGFAVAKNWMSSALSTFTISSFSSGNYDDSQQAELYFRIPLSKGIALTPSIQYIENSGFNTELANVWVYGARLTWVL